MDVAGVDLARRRKLQVLQPPAKRRILLKLLAVRFFIGKRDIASLVTWETEIIKDAERLMYEYSRVFGDLTPEVAFGVGFVDKVERPGDAWKMLIKIWEKRYKENVFRAPTKDDKKGKLDWYEQYKACREVRSESPCRRSERGD